MSSLFTEVSFHINFTELHLQVPLFLISGSANTLCKGQDSKYFEQSGPWGLSKSHILCFEFCLVSFKSVNSAVSLIGSTQWTTG